MDNIKLMSPLHSLPSISNSPFLKWQTLDFDRDRVLWENMYKLASVTKMSSSAMTDSAVECIRHAGHTFNTDLDYDDWSEEYSYRFFSRLVNFIALAPHGISERLVYNVSGCGIT
jgi:hypothetical protein